MHEDGARRERMPIDWTDRYLALLGVEREAPSLEALTRLVRAHVLTIPFENVTALLRRRDCPTGPVPPMDLDLLLDTWERRAGGGICFELATMFSRLLASLGYDIYVVLAQVSLPNGHQAIHVTLDGKRYLVDLGTGGRSSSRSPSTICRSRSTSTASATASGSATSQDNCSARSRTTAGGGSVVGTRCGRPPTRTATGATRTTTWSTRAGSRAR